MQRRRIYTLIAVIILFITAVYIGCFEFAVPAMAKFVRPARWRHLPLGQKRQVFYEYLGPAQGGYSAGNSENWIQPVRGNNYRLRIYFDSDTVGTRYQLYYQYSLLGLKREYLLATDSAR